MQHEQIPELFSIYGHCKNVVQLNEKSKPQLRKVNWFKHFINGFQRAVQYKEKSSSLCLVLIKEMNNDRNCNLVVG